MLHEKDIKLAVLTVAKVINYKGLKEQSITL
jgi:hypothetical protein